MTTKKSLGEFEIIVIAAIMRRGDDAYGVSIQDEIKSRTDRSVSVGALYATLSRLEEKGLISSRLGEATAKRGGRSKRYYAVTASGEARMKKSVTALAAMLEGVAQWSRRQTSP